MRKLVSQLFEQVASKSAKSKLLPPTGPVEMSFQNGFGFYVRPLFKLEFIFDLKSGDGTGLREFIDARLEKWTERYPSVEFIVSPINGKMAHVRGSYLSGPKKFLSAANKTCQEIETLLVELAERSGDKASRFRARVCSEMPAIRPLWTPFHGNRSNRMTKLLEEMGKRQKMRNLMLTKARIAQQNSFKEDMQRLAPNGN
jgi:hypothetical protein